MQAFYVSVCFFANISLVRLDKVSFLFNMTSHQLSHNQIILALFTKF